MIGPPSGPARSLRVYGPDLRRRCFRVRDERRRAGADEGPARRTVSTILVERVVKSPLPAGAWPNGMAPDSGSGGSRFESWRASQIDNPRSERSPNTGPFLVSGV